jgi:ketosteroid isomerase-like protein
MRFLVATLAFVLTATGADAPIGAQPSANLVQQVRDAERAFARSMASRDFKAFGELVADEAVFFGPKSVQRGKAAVLSAWKPFFDGPSAPFSWAPEAVEVLDSGSLAFSSGPVRDPSGKQTGAFNSIWRREAGGRWQVIFDKGCPPCDCVAPR